MFVNRFWFLVLTFGACGRRSLQVVSEAKNTVSVAVKKMKLPWVNWSSREEVEILKLPSTNLNCRDTFGPPHVMKSVRDTNSEPSLLWCHRFLVVTHARPCYSSLVCLSLLAHERAWSNAEKRCIGIILEKYVLISRTCWKRFLLALISISHLE